MKISTEYRRTQFWRVWFGNGWRSVWAAPIQVPVLDLGTYAGGLKPFKRGGNQTRTLRFHGADGRTYIFRSLKKSIHNALPDDVKNTPLGEVIQDQAASFHPTAALAVSELQKAVGILFAPPELVYMPDDPRLGEFREDFAHLVGQIEERPDEAEKGRTFAGAEKIIGSDKLLENLEAGMEDRFDSRDYLTARLLDFIIGDPDRGGDQWRFAKLEAGARDVYRVIPRDRDYAFMKSDGHLMTIGARLYPKLVHYNEKFPKLQSLVFMTGEFDRSHLVDLSWSDWQAVIAKIQTRLSDDVIQRAVAQLPPEHRRITGETITAGLRARRDHLAEIARTYFEMVSQDADVFASDEAERAEITRHQDGSVTVQIWREGAGGEFMTDGVHTPAFERRFLPSETHEIRVFLERGNDRAIVRGDVARSIKVRVIGGEGDDVLIDSSRVTQGDGTRFYDASGQNTIVRGADTHFTDRRFVTTPPLRSVNDEENLEPEENPREVSEERRGRFRDMMATGEGMISEKTQTGGARNWGSTMSLTPAFDFNEQSGVIVGAGPMFTNYGFRHRPYDWRLSAQGLIGLRNAHVGIRLAGDHYFEASRLSIGVEALASQLEANRFFGFGNDTEYLGRSLTLIERTEFSVFSALRYAFSRNGTVAFGPVVKYVRPDVPLGSPADLGAVLGTGNFGQIGARATLDLDQTVIGPAQQSGFGLTAGASAYPAVWDAREAFGEAHALARLFVPLGWPTLALRVGGQRVWGAFPLHEAAYIGGRYSLRGFSWNRYAGNASVFAGAQAHLPLARVTLLTRGQLGLIALTDAGRVWMNGESEGDWHTSAGGGLWFSTVGQTVSITYAHGERDAFYVSLGMPF